ncbi:hypothetical protein BKA83DRAFT_4385004 [Pisolithus microcarpus]|nr:hypothetical protein BKA83DRAFT_4385004 [Pisolithus microcarpus]
MVRLRMREAPPIHLISPVLHPIAKIYLRICPISLILLTNMMMYMHPISPILLMTMRIYVHLTFMILHQAMRTDLCPIFMIPHQTMRTDMCPLISCSRIKAILHSHSTSSTSAEPVLSLMLKLWPNWLFFRPCSTTFNLYWPSKTRLSMIRLPSLLPRLLRRYGTHPATVLFPSTTRAPATLYQPI